MVKTILTAACAVLWLVALVVMAFTTSKSEQWSKETEEQDKVALLRVWDEIELERFKEVVYHQDDLYNALSNNT